MKNSDLESPNIEPGGAPGEAMAAAPGGVVLDAAAALARTLTHPKLVGRAAGGFAAELGRVVVGRSAVEPPKGDRRFNDPAFTDHPIYHRVMQGYLAMCDSIGEVVEGADVTWRTRERARFAAGVLTSSIAPTNTLVGNPAAIKRAFDTGGASLIRGAKHFASDVRHNGGMPSQVDASGYTVGENIAASPGAVIFRNEVLELIQYTPSTDKVRELPVMLVPPQINKYYFMDLAPGRSFVEHAVGRGVTMFVVSWRNPGKDQGEWNLDTYARAILDATDAIREITGSEELITISLCAGGITTSTVLSYLASIGDTRVKAASFAVTLLDWETPAPRSGPSTAVRCSPSPSARARSRVCSTRVRSAPCSPGCARTTWSGTTGSTTT